MSMTFDEWLALQRARRNASRRAETMAAISQASGLDEAELRVGMRAALRFPASDRNKLCDCGHAVIDHSPTEVGIPCRDCECGRLTLRR